MKFLALDTVFEQCAVALLSETGEVLHAEVQLGKRQQTQQILPMIEAALTHTQTPWSDIAALIFNQGPGAFSGIRINTAVVQALSLAHDIPCVGVSSLQALAQSGVELSDASRVYAVMDARMNQVYLGEYQLDSTGMMQAVETAENSDDGQSEAAERLVDYDTLLPHSYPLVGDGASLMRAHESQMQYDSVRPDAVLMGRLGMVKYAKEGGVSAEQALPVYLRNNAWKTLAEQGKA